LLALESVFSALTLSLHCRALTELKPSLTKNQRLKIDKEEGATGTPARLVGDKARALAEYALWQKQRAATQTTVMQWMAEAEASNSRTTLSRALLARAQFVAQHLRDVLRLRYSALVHGECKELLKTQFAEQLPEFERLLNELEQSRGRLADGDPPRLAERRSLLAALRAELNRLMRSNGAPFYAPVNADEMRAVYRAMAADVGSGQGSFGGHWYTCKNGHPYAIGQTETKSRERRTAAGRSAWCGAN
jgi:hypothetical protein